jgi:two-component system, NarL family, nitrate/nitrite response regulator NarL
MAAAARVLLADDDPITRAFLRQLLEAAGFQVIGEAADGQEAVQLTTRLLPDVLVLDLLMPNSPGMDAIRELASSPLPVRIVVLSSSISKEQIVKALQLGARGILQKNAVDELEKAIAAVLQGQYWIAGRSVGNIVQVLADLSATLANAQPVKSYGLTPRELEMVRFVTQGCSNREIAARLSISEETVKRHLSNVFDKVGMSNRVELTLFALEHRLAVVD